MFRSPLYAYRIFFKNWVKKKTTTRQLLNRFWQAQLLIKENPIWHKWVKYMSCDMDFPTILYVRPAKAQTSLRIWTVWSEPLLVTWILYDSKATDRTLFEVSKFVWVYTCQNARLLEITCSGSTLFYNIWIHTWHTLEFSPSSNLHWAFIL